MTYQYHYTEHIVPTPLPAAAAADPEYSWSIGCYDACSVSCGSGLSIARPVCTDQSYPDRVVPEEFCEGHTKPAPHVRKCHTEPCPARYTIGSQLVYQCSASGGSRGVPSVPRNPFQKS